MARAPTDAARAGPGSATRAGGTGTGTSKTRSQSPFRPRYESDTDRTGPRTAAQPRALPPGETSMASANPVATRKYFSVEEANKTLPLVKQIVGDIVRQFGVVSE